MTREERQKAIDALKISTPIMAMTQEEFNDYIQTLNEVMDWLEQDTVSRESYDHEYFLRKEFEIKIDKLEQQEPKWISVRERLPEDGQSVLFCDIDDDIMVGYHVEGRPITHFSQDGTYEDMKNVRAWMPLPKPYEPQEKRCEDCNHYGKLSLDCGRCDDDCSMFEPKESEV